MADDSEPSTDLACVPSEEDIRFTPVDVVYGKKPLKQLRQYILGELLGKGSCLHHFLVLFDLSPSKVLMQR